jgi:hypothetical protein
MRLASFRDLDAAAKHPADIETRCAQERRIHHERVWRRVDLRHYGAEALPRPADARSPAGEEGFT